jgi:flotillin
MGFIGVVLAIAVLAVLTIVITVKKLLYICQPNEVLIFSGGKGEMGFDEQRVGYKAIKGGRKIKVPLLEVIDRMDLTNMVINVAVHGAFSKGGIPLNVDGVANVKISGHGDGLANAAERLLGKDKSEIMSMAKEILEGSLRGVLATLTPEEVNADKMEFAKRLIGEAHVDLHQLGLVLDTLKIQNVSDGQGYLDSIGRIASANIRRDATIAEANNRMQSIKRDAENRQDTETVRIKQAVRTLEAQTQKKVADAVTSQKALVAEARGDVVARIAEAEAEVAVQRARTEQVRLRLEADVIVPAKAQLEAKINRARADAAKITEQGKATAKVLEIMTHAWQKAGPQARDVFLMQKLEQLVDTLSKTVEGIKVDKVTVLGTSKNGAAGADLAGQVIAINERLKAALGVDLVGALQDRIAPAAARQALEAPVKSGPTAQRGTAGKRPEGSNS